MNWLTEYKIPLGSWIKSLVDLLNAHAAGLFDLISWVLGGLIDGMTTALVAIARFLVKASGLNKRPSCASRVKTGMNATAITNKDAKIDGPTSLAESISTCVRSPTRPFRSHSSRRRWALSTMTMDASTMSPIATIMPPIDMMFMPMPMK